MFDFVNTEYRYCENNMLPVMEMDPGLMLCIFCVYLVNTGGRIVHRFYSV